MNEDETSVPYKDVAPLPYSWASYLISGDASSLQEGEKQRIDDYLYRNDIVRVVGIVEGAKPYFSSALDVRFHGFFGELISYNIEMTPNDTENDLDEWTESIEYLGIKLRDGLPLD